MLNANDMVIILPDGMAEVKLTYGEFMGVNKDKDYYNIKGSDSKVSPIHRAYVLPMAAREDALRVLATRARAKKEWDDSMSFIYQLRNKYA